MSLKVLLSRSSFGKICLIRLLQRNVNLYLYRCLMQTKALRCEPEAVPEKKKVQLTEGANGYIVREIDPIESIKYMESEAYREVYGNEAVWTNYRRNHKGHFITKPRKTCIRKGVISTGSACPLCRDDYLVVDYRNIKLLEQFIDPITGEAFLPLKTGICLRQYKRLKLEIWKAQDYGYLMKHFPFRVYNYEYFLDLRDEKLLQVIEDPSERKKIEQERNERRTSFLNKQLIKYQ